MAWLLCTALLAAMAASAAASAAPAVPAEYSAVILMKMPYIGLEMPMQVLLSGSAQKVEYYNGLVVAVSNEQGVYKYVYQNGHRACMYSPAGAGPTSAVQANGLNGSAFQPLAFLPDLAQYNFSGQELVGGILCNKYTMHESHGTTGIMDDHLAFYWDPVLSKPVRWHMHSRHKTFGSHTDEYIMDFLHFEAGAPAADALVPPTECRQPQQVNVSLHVSGFPASAGAASAEAEPLLFEAFLRKYGKSYAAAEREVRRGVFERNVRLVQELNRRHAGAARFRGNGFLDMTREEVLRLKGGKPRGALRDARRSPEHLAFVSAHRNSSKPLPSGLDWRQERPGVVGPVKDQAMCGSCWTYGATEPIESISAIRTGRLVPLPEQFLLDCTWTNGTEGGASNLGCDGGNSDIGVLEVVRKYGGIIPTAMAYGSYLSVNGYCRDTRLMEVGAKVTGWSDVKARDEQAVLDALVSQGPLSISIMVPDEMLFYDSGVLKVESCRHNETQIDHAVVLVGYGTDEHGTDYYTIRNSWSTYWGDRGYIKVARGDLDCCVSSEAGYPLLDAQASTAAMAIVV